MDISALMPVHQGLSGKNTWLGQGFLIVTQGRFFCVQSTVMDHQSESSSTESPYIARNLEVKEQFRILYERARKVHIKMVSSFETFISRQLLLYFRKTIS